MGSDSLIGVDTMYLPGWLMTALLLVRWIYGLWMRIELANNFTVRVWRISFFHHVSLQVLMMFFIVPMICLMGGQRAESCF